MVDLERLKHFYSGLGQFCFHLGRELIQQPRPEMQLTYLLPPAHNSHWDELRSQKHLRAGLKRRLFPLLNPSFDLWHATHQDSRFFPAERRDRYLLTIHDLNFLGEKSEKKVRHRLKRLQQRIDRSHYITTVSHYTKSQVEKHLRIDDRTPIEVVYNGVPASQIGLAKCPKALDEAFLRRPFLFALGVVRPKKNFHVLLPLVEGQDFNLVIAGNTAHDYAQNLKEQIAAQGLQDQVRLIGEVDEGERQWLYQNCQAFVFPSLLEGFGFPVIEAMSFGKATFVSDRTCLPEVAGPEAYVWSHFEPQAMRETLHSGLKDYARDTEKPTRLQAWAGRFTWSEAANKYLSLYEKILY